MCTHVAETASGDATDAWNTSGQSPTCANASPCQGSGASWMDEWTQFVSLCQTTSTFCSEHELASTEAAKLICGMEWLQIAAAAELTIDIAD